MKRNKLPRQRFRVKPFDKRVINTGPHKEGMNALYGSSSPTRQQSLHHLQRDTPPTLITRDVLDAARHQGPIKTAEGEYDPVSPLVRVLLRREQEGGEPVETLRTVGLMETFARRDYCLYSTRQAFIVRHNRVTGVSDYSITYPTLSRALLMYKNGMILYK